MRTTIPTRGTTCARGFPSFASLVGVRADAVSVVGAFAADDIPSDAALDAPAPLSGGASGSRRTRR